MTAGVEELRGRIEQFAAGVPAGAEAEARQAFDDLTLALQAGTVRAASRAADGSWQANAWVKSGILLGFRIGAVVELAGNGSLPFTDKDTYGIRRFGAGDGVRVVPGGSSVREGAYLGRGVVCMPPMYVNAGAYVDDGSCANRRGAGTCGSVAGGDRG
ncbi:MAG: 2,3,4,5-tetrahydropyridine-2,6-dicarboxylate N-succinyltransferase [Gemmatimonadales bacterium]